MPPSDTPTKYNGIIIRLRADGESGMFPTLVQEALAKIESKTVGKSLLTQIAALSGKAKFGYTVCIMRPGNLGIVEAGDGKGPQWNSGSVAKRGSEADACNGTGCNTAVTWNANVIETPDGARPGFIALSHELIHALYNLKGEAYSDTSTEEYATVGLAPCATLRPITENKIRAEHGVARRDAYKGLSTPTLTAPIVAT